MDVPGDEEGMFKASFRHSKAVNCPSRVQEPCREETRLPAGRALLLFSPNGAGEMGGRMLLVDSVGAQESHYPTEA